MPLPCCCCFVVFRFIFQNLGFSLHSSLKGFLYFIRYNYGRFFKWQQETKHLVRQAGRIHIYGVSFGSILFQLFYHYCSYGRLSRYGTACVIFLDVPFYIFPISSFILYACLGFNFAAAVVAGSVAVVLLLIMVMVKSNFISSLIFYSFQIKQKRATFSICKSALKITDPKFKVILLLSFFGITIRTIVFQFCFWKYFICDFFLLQVGIFQVK